MKLIKDIYIQWHMLVLACALCAGCVEELEFIDRTAMPEGETDVELNVVFEPLAETALETRATNAPSGDALNDIYDICVLLFDKEKKLMENGIREVKGSDLEFVDEPGYDTDRHAKFKLEDMPYGEYYMFAVANLGNHVITSASAAKTSTYQELEKLRNEGLLTDIEALKSIQLTWDPESIYNNAEMLGYFTAGAAPGKPEAFDNAQPLLINRDKMSFHSWLCRAASKVTIEFDPSGLRNNIRIYLKSARLRHIPLHCPLGNKNVPSDEGDLVPDSRTPYFHIDYYPNPNVEDVDADDYETWMTLAKGGVLDGISGLAKTEYDGMHTSTAKALYFYENMQGTGKDKRQDANGDGELDYPGKNTSPGAPGYMDQKPYGTYVEIEGHYVSNAPGNYGQGTIFYRFMLGKDTETDYNASRNNHYKLTLKFRGNANDVDWHIDYTPESDILYAPDPYYISYLYNQTMNLPLYVSGKLREGDHIDLKIIKNGWGPSDPDVLKKMYPFELSKIAGNPVCNGFLSLKKSLNPNGVLVDPNVVNPPRHTDYNLTYWNLHELGELQIGYNDLHEAIAVDGVVNVPLYTREKQLIVTTSFTGNNIYPHCRREAIVEVSGVIGGKEVEAKEIKILQMRRIINPSGVFRKSTNTGKFLVTLTFRTSTDASEFEQLHSIGPWRAKLKVGTGWKIIDAEDGVISGDDGTVVSFYVQPESVIGDNETRCAYVDIEYNNYTCHHRVLLRQGDAPIALVDNPAARKWYYYNMRTKDEMVTEPMDEGSMFRYGNADQPISSENQTMQNVGKNAGSLKIEGGGSLDWNEIDYSVEPDGFSNDVFMDGAAEPASYDDYSLLFATDDMDYKYGIIYGDDAEKTALNTDSAMSYNRYHNSSSSNGMRGVFLYNSKNARSIFLPIGCTGMGRRKDKTNEEGYGRRGVLRYAQRSPDNRWIASSDPNDQFALANQAPLFYDIHEFEGALYWFNMESYSNHSTDHRLANAWDINFRTLDFNDFSLEAAHNYSNDKKKEDDVCDAAFIRCVVKE